MTDPTAAPLHGFRGDEARRLLRPRGLTVAVSRLAGARGGTIARRAGEQLGWPVFDGDALDSLARDETARTELFTDLPAGAKEWADAELDRIAHARTATAAGDLREPLRLMLALAARGEVVLVGRGAGFVLPAATTLHVRVIAPRDERLAYMADWLRLAPDEAAAELDSRDRRRTAVLATLSSADPAEASGYDLVLNSGRLGEHLAADLIVQAVRGRHAETDSLPDFDPV